MTLKPHFIEIGYMKSYAKAHESVSLTLLVICRESAENKTEWVSMERQINENRSRVSKVIKEEHAENIFTDIMILWHYDIMILYYDIMILWY